jgi:hypothetical protein
LGSELADECDRREVQGGEREEEADLYDVSDEVGEDLVLLDLLLVVRYLFQHLQHQV